MTIAPRDEQPRATAASWIPPRSPRISATCIPRSAATRRWSRPDRCYFCYDAPCQQACPTSIDIPLFIREIASDNPLGAARTILEDNIMGGICARVCPTETCCCCPVSGVRAGPRSEFAAEIKL